MSAAGSERGLVAVSIHDLRREVERRRRHMREAQEAFERFDTTLNSEALAHAIMRFDAACDALSAATLHESPEVQAVEACEVPIDPDAPDPLRGAAWWPESLLWEALAITAIVVAAFAAGVYLTGP
jgi:hypothetical protein